MNEWSTIFFFSIISSAMMLSGIGIWFSFVMPGTDHWSKRFFRRYFIVLMLGCLSGLADMIISYNVSSISLLYICVIFLECFILSVPLPMLTVYLLHCCGKDIRQNWGFRTVLVLWAVYCILLAILSYQFIFTVITPDSMSYRTPLYSFMLLSLVAIQAVNFTVMIRYKTRLSRKGFFSFTVVLLPITVGLILQMFIDVFPLLDIGYVIAALVIYSFAMSDQVEQEMNFLRENAHQRASIMVLQMRPHFIYNTLMSIYSLCSIDPGKARQVTMDFSNYLRKNMNAVTSDSPIPFSAELEHTRAYLAVEQAQHEELLHVEYNISFTLFRLPPLTLQPLVENAVKHGMNPYSGPLHISIRTRHTDSGAEITVEDDGPGFDPADASKPQTTLANIRQRLEMMCGGTLQIVSGEGRGTVATVIIPDRDPQ